MFTRSLPHQSRPLTRERQAQRGVVLIIALIMLVIISLMTATSVRNTSSSEAVNSNVRQTQLADQAAQTALRYCEDAVGNFVNNGTGNFTVTSPPGTTAVTFSALHLQAYTPGAAPLSVSATNWDSTAIATANPNSILVLNINLVNLAGTTFSRPPECMVEQLDPASATLSTLRFNITARGFGPEVAAADASRTRPTGSTVWLQSTIGI